MRRNITSVALLSIVLLVMPTPIFAEQTTITKEMSFLEGTACPTFAAEIVEDGRTYALDEVSAPILDRAYQPTSKTFTKWNELAIYPEELDSLDSQLPTSQAIEDGQYIGEIPRTDYQIEPFYQSFTGQVDRTITVERLSSNDVSQIPLTQEFEVRSDQGPNATQTKTLKLLDVRFVPNRSSDNERPATWNATCVYRGEESWLDIHHYKVTAVYSGSINSNVDRFRVTANYSEVAPAPVIPETDSGPAQTLTSNPQAPIEPAAVQGINLPLLIAVGASVFVILVGAVLAWLFAFRHNIQLLESIGGRERCICRKRIQVVNGKAHFALPEDLQIYSKQYSLILKPSLVDKNGVLSVSYRDRVILETAFSRLIDLNQKTDVVRDVSAYASILAGKGVI
ncbi:MAG: hypothetical protein LBH87_01180 [Coriobacteriales bacterium]|jgi:hypothetical protein|nr:hypothetical protein [Coriobacteriales bacterium]